MKSVINKSYLILSALFAVGVAYSAYLLYNLPANLERISSKIDLTAINEASSVFSTVNLVFGVTLLSGVIALLMLYYKMSNVRTAEKIVYVERKDDDQQKSAALQADQTKQADLTKQAADIVAAGRGIKDVKVKYETLLSKLCMKIDASQALYYIVKKEKGGRFIEMISSFAFSMPESDTIKYEFGEGLAGQVAKEGKMLNIGEVPKGYITIISGLGSASPNHLAILPIKQGEEVVAVVEVASFKEIALEDIALITEVLKPEDESTKTTRKSTATDGAESQEVGKN